MPDTDLKKLSISELAPKIRAREVSPLEVINFPDLDPELYKGSYCLSDRQFYWKRPR